MALQGVRIEDELVLPAEVDDLESFRRWTCSERFPEHGRIDFLAGLVGVDRSPAELQTHGVLKGALCFHVKRVVHAGQLGQVFVDRTRLVSRKAGLSCEPDVLFVSWSSLRRRRVRSVAASEGEPERFVEVEGAADLAVEVLGRGSVAKDTERLPPLYAAAGVRELWLADARLPELSFRILHLRAGAYHEARPTREGFRRSRVLGRSLRLRREPGPVAGTWLFFVDEA